MNLKKDYKNIKKKPLKYFNKKSIECLNMY